MASPPQANESSLQSRVIAFDIDKADSYLLGKSVCNDPNNDIKTPYLYYNSEVCVCVCARFI